MKDYIKLSKSEKEKIMKKISGVVGKYPSIKTTVAFGSFVTRKYFKDIDIAIVPSNKINEKKLEEIANKIEREIKIEVDLKDFTKLPLKLRFFVIKYGKIAKCEDPRFFQKIRRETILSYLDFRHVEKFYEKRWFK